MMLVMIGVCGAIGGAFFWLIRRPDRDTHTPRD